ncbi:hypothetical protein [Cerasicoccus maritimus]|uniref:hypothetical protein n=1 Tax=Cerasicoccus maritimus TaxID=490089 RepID=UPI00285276AD|nr:hypothetical protein [Cerasicoccus maritimus]
MKPKKRLKEEPQLFQQDLEHMLDQRQALYQAANRIDWATLERASSICIRTSAAGQAECR